MQKDEDIWSPAPHSKLEAVMPGLDLDRTSHFQCDEFSIWGGPPALSSSCLEWDRARSTCKAISEVLQQQSNIKPTLLGQLSGWSPQSAPHCHPRQGISCPEVSLSSWALL